MIVKQRGHKANVKVEPKGALFMATVTFTEHRSEGPVVVRSIELPQQDARQWGERIAKSLIRDAAKR